MISVCCAGWHLTQPVQRRSRQILGMERPGAVSLSPWELQWNPQDEKIHGKIGKNIWENMKIWYGSSLSDHILHIHSDIYIQLFHCSQSFSYLQYLNPASFVGDHDFTMTSWNPRCAGWRSPCRGRPLRSNWHTNHHKMRESMGKSMGKYGKYDGKVPTFTAQITRERSARTL